MKPGTLFIVSAPSGAGKTSLVQAVLKQIGSQCAIKRVITYTTKQPRSGEIDGTDYYFVTDHEFKRKIEEGFFIEHSTAYGCYYGSPCSVLQELAHGISYIMVVDRDGAKQIIKQLPQAVLIWIAIPDFEVLQQRLTGRNTENRQQLTKRLLLAQQEMEEEQRIKLYHHHILNDDFECAVQELVATLLSYIV